MKHSNDYPDYVYKDGKIVGKFEEMYEKIREFKRIKEMLNSIKPVIAIQALWPAIKDAPIAYYNTFDPYVDSIASIPLIDYLHNDTQDKIEYVDNFTCPVLFQRLVVGSVGKVLLCSNDEMGKYIIGDANNETLKHIWRSEKINQARKMHIEHRGYKQIA